MEPEGLERHPKGWWMHLQSPATAPAEVFILHPLSTSSATSEPAPPRVTAPLRQVNDVENAVTVFHFRP